MHRTGELYGQFETLEQQKESASLGMWVFLATEVLFFGGLFMTYTLNRALLRHGFGVGSNTLDLKLGGLNTVILILSSLTMAMSVWASHVGKKKQITSFLIAHAGPGQRVSGRQGSRVQAEIRSPSDSRIPLSNRLPRAASRASDDPKEIEAEKEELAKAFEKDPDLNAHAQLYFSLYFGMTGLHALHMIVGAGMLLWLIKESIAGRFTPQYNTPVEMIGLYWHFVDIVWIYLFPLLYLIDRHR